MKKILLLLMLIFLSARFPVGAIELESNELELNIQGLKYGSTDYANLKNQSQQGGEFYNEFGDDEGIFEYDYKSPKRAFVYSLLIPGLGQRYSESHALKTLAFIGVEVGLWMGYFNRHNKGDIATDDYEHFADDHWFVGLVTDDSASGTYRGWLNWKDSTEDDFTHTISETKDQQYYEMIGKYEQFRGGWDDYWDDPLKYDSVDFYTSPNRETYLTMRKDANDYYDMANRFLIFTMVNHLVSAFDAALSAKRYNKKKAAESWLSVKTEMRKYSATESIPVVKFTYGF